MCRRQSLLGSNREGSHPPHHSNGKYKQKSPVNDRAFLFEFDGGEGGIRTLGTLPYTHFPGVLLRPLGHLTAKCLRSFYELNNCTPACSLPSP